jgi:hypothetical protein
MIKHVFFSSRLYVSLLILITFPASAQTNYPNSLQFGADNFFYPQLRKFSFGINENVADQFSLSYERSVCKSFCVSLGFSEWNSFLFKKEYPVGPIVKGNEHGSFAPGTLEWRYKYKMVDAIAMYKHAVTKRHTLSVGPGISYAWGTNVYVDTVFYNTGPPYDALVVSSVKIKHYFGLDATVQYDYSLFKSRVNVGVDFKGRKYFGLNSMQVEYGVHTGVNF